MLEDVRLGTETVKKNGLGQRTTRHPDTVVHLRGKCREDGGLFFDSPCGQRPLDGAQATGEGGRGFAATEAQGGGGGGGSANYWAPRTRKQHQQEHRPQRPTESSDPTQHAKGRTGDRPGPRKGATTRRNVTQGGANEARAWADLCLAKRGAQIRRNTGNGKERVEPPPLVHFQTAHETGNSKVPPKPRNPP